MSKYVTIAVLTLCLASGGCVQMHSEVELAKDGSGTFTMSYSMSAEVAESIQQLQEMPSAGGSQDAPTLDDFDRKRIDELAREHGVTVTSFARGDEDGRETVSFSLEFDQLADVSAFINDATDGEGDGMAIFKTPEGDYLLDTVAGPPAVRADAEAGVHVDSDETPVDPAQMSPEDMEKSMAIMGQLMESLPELDVSMTITVPGEIISSNAPTVEGRSSIWAINAENMMQAGSNLQPEIVFSGKGLKIKGAEEQR